MILAGDIGGTKCNLALYQGIPDGYRKIFHERYASHEFASFELLLDKFLADSKAQISSSDAGPIEAAGFGVAGPVLDHRVKATNLLWVVDGASLAAQLGTREIVLLNDLEATGYGLEHLAPSDLSILNPGTEVPGTARALLAAGTGLGEAYLYYSGGRYVVGSSEGGHADFAPRTEREIELLRFLKKTNDCVSVELILSGRGFRVIHEFLDPSVRHPSFSEPGADAAPEISHLGLSGECPVCVETLDLWISMYGAEAGNLALKVLARGGVWVAGGIAAKLRMKMEDGTFVKAFCRKEKFAGLLAQIPIHLVLNEDAPLLGAMSRAGEQAKGRSSGAAGS